MLFRAGFTLTCRCKISPKYLFAGVAAPEAFHQRVARLPTS